MAGAQGIKAGQAYVELGTFDDTARGLRMAQRRLKAFGASVQAIGLKMFLAAGAGVAAFTSTVKTFAAAGDTVEKMGRRTGLSTEALSELGFAAEQSGTDLATVEKGVRTFQRAINDAERGLSTAIDAFDDLGLTVEDFRGLSPEKQFELLADRMDKVVDPSKRAALAMMLMGRAGTQLLPMMEGGAAGMAKLRQQASDLGLTISSESAASAALLTDEFNIMQRVLRVVRFEVGGALAPVFIGLSRAVTRAASAIVEWIKGHRRVVAIASAAVTAIAGLGLGMVAFGLTIQVISFALGELAMVLTVATTAFSLLAAAMALITSVSAGIIATVVAVSALGTAIVYYSGAGGVAIGWLKEQFGTLGAFVGKVVGGIADALLAGDLALAAKVMWAGVRVAWMTGIKPLSDAWEQFKFAFKSAAIDAFAGLKAAWIDVSTWMWKQFPNLTAHIARTWAGLTSTLSSTWATFQNWLSDQWLEIMGWFDEGLDVRAAQALGRQDLNADLAAIASKYAADVTEANRKQGLTPAEHEAEKKVALAKVEADRLKEIGKLETDYSGRVQAANDALAAAQAELAAARQEATTAREVAGIADPLDKLKAMLADLSSGLGGVGAAGAVTGTFNVAALFGLGGKGPMDRTAAATEETAKYLKEIKRRKAEATFG